MPRPSVREALIYNMSRPPVQEALIYNMSRPPVQEALIALSKWAGMDGVGSIEKHTLRG
jgi:hypothetical protein